MDKNINFLVFGRFPTERAYGVHVVSNAKSYQNFGKVKIIYPSTTNSKTIDSTPEEYFSRSDGIVFEKIDFYDINQNGLNVAVFSGGRGSINLCDGLREFSKVNVETTQYFFSAKVQFHL